MSPHVQNVAKILLFKVEEWVDGTDYSIKTKNVLILLQEAKKDNSEKDDSTIEVKY
ncbi:11873_t:CDS:2 [Diversispora eburnea]|uniref:11873_t:CDS:1 n=1 Tax=Diversispora eburnea TaxID=1213867 RepID=A0A9N8YSU7_9GLOM|nr:11873_t:CDS:2 [Diversispora eburnea]